MFGLRPWFAFERRAFIFFFWVRFDIQTSLTSRDEIRSFEQKSANLSEVCGAMWTRWRGAKRRVANMSISADVDRKCRQVIAELA